MPRHEGMSAASAIALVGGGPRGVSLLERLVSALADLPEMAATEIGATRILNGNPGQVLGHAEFGEEVWVSRNGRALCIGRYMGGEVQPSRVFNLG